MGRGGPGRIIQSLVSSVASPQQPKSVEQPRVPAQMDAPQPLTKPAGPTVAEITERQLTAKRKGRRANILTGIDGPQDTLSLGYKSLLG